ncbi:hypothetical protein Tco_0510115, partial [Tanacetum coccineum]
QENKKGKGPDWMFDLELLTPSMNYIPARKENYADSGGCQYLGGRLVSWQCKKQTIMAISSTKAEYVAAASCCAQTMRVPYAL